MNKYCDEWNGQIITNQPNMTLKDTGYYHTDQNGCWHEVLVIKTNAKAEFEVGDLFYMIGNYPDFDTII